MDFIELLENAFKENQNTGNAVAMAKYMRNNFTFFGIDTKERRTILKSIWKENKLVVDLKAREIAVILFAKKEREFHYCAIEIITKQLKRNYKQEDIILIEKLITTNSWWDSVDSIAKNILGQYLLEHPNKIIPIIERFSNSKNIWLIRSVILFQLGYKTNTNFDLLKSECEKHKTSKDFFIQKAIGWALREYSKTNPENVKNYVNSSNLMPLSQKEALKNFF